MVVQISNGWFWFCVAFGIMLVASVIMGLIGRAFYTDDGTVRKFSIMELEFPSSALEIVNIIKGMYKLPTVQCQKAIRGLRLQFVADFILFMPATYGGIFILCMKVADRMGTYGHVVFSILAWLQLLAFLFDSIENIYLWRKIRKDVTKSSALTHAWYISMEKAKWAIALLGAIGSFSVLLYYWVAGRYDDSSIKYVLTFLAEILVFIAIAILASLSAKKDQE